MRHFTAILVSTVLVTTVSYGHPDGSSDPFSQIDWNSVRKGGYAVVTEKGNDKNGGSPTVYTSKTPWSPDTKWASLPQSSTPTVTGSRLPSSAASTTGYNTAKQSDPSLTKEKQDNYQWLVDYVKPSNPVPAQPKENDTTELNKDEQNLYNWLVKNLTPVPASDQQVPTKTTTTNEPVSYNSRYNAGPSTRPSWSAHTTTTSTDPTEPSTISPSPTRVRQQWSYHTPSTYKPSPSYSPTSIDYPVRPATPAVQQPSSPYDNTPTSNDYPIRPATPVVQPTSRYDNTPATKNFPIRQTTPAVQQPTSRYDIQPSTPSSYGRQQTSWDYPSSPSSPSVTTGTNDYPTTLQTNPSVTSGGNRKALDLSENPDAVVLNRDEFDQVFPQNISPVIQMRKSQGLM